MGDNETQYLQLDYDRFIPLLIEGMKELKAENLKLRKENAQLRGELALIKAKDAELESRLALLEQKVGGK